MWKWHYWPTLDYDEPLFTEELTGEEVLERIEGYERLGWRQAFRYSAAVQFENKPEVSLFTTNGTDWLTSPFYRGQTTERLGAEMRVESKREVRRLLNE